MPFCCYVYCYADMFFLLVCFDCTNPTKSLFFICSNLLNCLICAYIIAIRTENDQKSIIAISTIKIRTTSGHFSCTGTPEISRSSKNINTRVYVSYDYDWKEKTSFNVKHMTISKIADNSNTSVTSTLFNTARLID